MSNSIVTRPVQRKRAPVRRRLQLRQRTMLTYVSFAIFAFLAIICLCPLPAHASDATGIQHEDFGHVIGIGRYLLRFDASLSLAHQIWEPREFLFALSLLFPSNLSVIQLFLCWVRLSVVQCSNR